MPNMELWSKEFWLYQELAGVVLTKERLRLPLWDCGGMCNAAQLWTEFAEIVHCSQKSAYSCFIGWGWSLNDSRVWLEAFSGDEMAHERGLAAQKFHFVDIDLTWCFSKRSSTAISFRLWSNLASALVEPQPGTKMSSAMLIIWRPSKSVWIRRCHSSDVDDIPNGSLVHL